MNEKRSGEAQARARKTAADGLSGPYITDEQRQAINDALIDGLSPKEAVGDVAIGFYTALSFLSMEHEDIRPEDAVRVAKEAMALTLLKGMMKMDAAE